MTGGVAAEQSVQPAAVAAAVAAEEKAEEEARLMRARAEEERFQARLMRVTLAKERRFHKDVAKKAKDALAQAYAREEQAVKEKRDAIRLSKRPGLGVALHWWMKRRLIVGCV